MKKDRKKWLPIINILCEHKEVSDETINLLCDYAEHHSVIDNKKQMVHESFDNWTKSLGGNLLPISLKILSKLNLEDIKVELIETGFDTIPFEILIENASLENSIDDIAKYESILVGKVVEGININIQKYNTLKLHTICNSISIQSDPVRMILLSNIKFE